MKLWCALIVLGLLQGRTLYEDRAKSLRVTNYTEAEGGTDASGNFVFSVSGQPAIVESRLDGLKVTGPSMSGVVAHGSPSQSFLRKLDVQGGTTLTIDSKSKYLAQVEHAQCFQLPSLPVPRSEDHGELTTESLAYVGEEKTGQFTIPGKFTLEFVSDGKSEHQEKVGSVTKAVHQEMKLNGISGTVSLNPAGVGLALLRKGQIAGPVIMHMVRTETDLTTQKQEPMTVDGSADRIEFDLVDTRTITLVGNVKLSGENPVYAGASEGDQAVITLDESMRPIKIRIIGSPTKSTAKEKGGGGK